MSKLTTLITLCCSLIAIPAFSQNAPQISFSKGAKYVALGSSFASGPGIPEELGVCGRSNKNYAHLIAEELDLKLIDVTCGGATTDNILSVPQGDALPQIDAVTDDTALVSFTIGGNDIGYTLSTFVCSNKAPEESCTANLLARAILGSAVNQLPAKLKATIDAIKLKAPQAIIVLVPYPRVFPIDATSCGELNLSTEDTEFLSAHGQKLEDAFVSVASSQNILIADAYVRAEGHGPCAKTERWVNGANVIETGVPFHPTAEGHIEMARLVLAALEGK